MQKKKKMFIVLLSVLSLLNWPAFEWNDQKALAAITRTVDAPQADIERLKADFSYEMAQLTAKIVAAPNNNIIRFKVMVANEVDQTVAKVTAMLPREQIESFRSEMEQIKDKIYKNPQPSYEKAKADFSYDIAQLTTKYMARTDREVAVMPPQPTAVVLGMMKNSASVPATGKNAETVDFRTEMEQLVATVNAAPNSNVIRFKVLVANEVDQTVAKVAPGLPPELRSEFGSTMEQIKNKIYGNPKLNFEKAKGEFSQDIALLTARISPRLSNNSGRVNPSSGRGTAQENAKALPPADQETGSADFRSEMERLTSTVNAAPNSNVIRFKVMVANEVDQTVTRVSPKLPMELRSEFSSTLEQIKNKIYGDPKLNFEKAKADFSQGIALLTARISPKLNNSPRRTNSQVTGTVDAKTPDYYSTTPKEGEKVQRTVYAGNSNVTGPLSPDSLSRSREVEKKQQGPYDTSKPGVVAKPLTPESYSAIMQDLKDVGTKPKPLDKKIAVDGSLRLHYAVNTGSSSWGRNTSGLLARIGFEGAINENWRFNGLIEGKKNIKNYEDAVTGRFHVTGKLGASTLKLGSFGYFMADGNIYDSSFLGGRFEIGKPIKYTFAYGETNYSRQNTIITARYDDLDYNVEAGYYHHRLTATGSPTVGVWNLAGNYKFSNFSLGTMILVASKKDTAGNNFGYVLSFNYGDLKTWRKGTYNIWARYYYQPRYTFIAPSMNGRGGWMNGFKGFGMGINYTIAKNWIATMEYYNLRDIITGAPGSTWWLSVTTFF